MWKHLVGWGGLVIALIFLSIALIWSLWWYPANYEYSLKLADDASLPQVKADYLQDYLDKVSTISGEPRYIFKRPDINLEKQRQILRGLIQRFRDVAAIEPSNMAYQQGMEQLTGQELDHQLKRISGIFYSARLRENPLIFLLVVWLSWLFFLIPTIVLGIIFEESF